MTSGIKDIYSPQINEVIKRYLNLFINSSNKGADYQEL